MPSRNWVQLLGVRVDNVTWASLDEYFRQSLKGTSPQQVVTVNGEHILAASHEARHREVINNAHLVVPDSTNVLWASRLKGRGLAQKTPGVDIVLHLAQIAAETGASLFLLGSRPGIAQRAADKLQAQFPDLKIAGVSSADPAEPYLSKRIRDARADIVLVAYGAPKQEYWTAEHKKETGAKILVGVGGTFDILAGVLPRAPQLWRYLQLEWLWRLILQPSRIGRIWNAVVVFPFKVVFWTDRA